ncbi:MAG: XTP/dITP diphosphatase [Verrucomicrobiota bacterium]
MEPQKSLVIATGNPGKAKEFAEMLGQQWQIRTLKDFPEISDVIEDGDSFETNACKKAREISEQVEGWVLADDSGLEVDYLDGAPGIYSARYAGPEKDDEANNQKLLKELDGVPDKQRGAQFHCVLAIAKSGEVLKTFSGIIRGKILTEYHGSNGFGYDPLFLPDGYRVTTAEMAPHEKHNISHRGLASKQASSFLKDACL